MSSGNSSGQRPSWPPAGPGPNGGSTAPGNRAAARQTSQNNQHPASNYGDDQGYHPDWPSSEQTSQQRPSASAHNAGQNRGQAEPALQSPWPSRGRSPEAPRDGGAGLAQQTAPRQTFGQRPDASPQYRQPAPQQAPSNAPARAASGRGGETYAPQFEPYQAPARTPQQRPAQPAPRAAAEPVSDYRAQNYADDSYATAGRGAGYGYDNSDAAHQGHSQGHGQSYNQSPSRAANTHSLDVGSYGAPDGHQDAYDASTQHDSHGGYASNQSANNAYAHSTHGQGNYAQAGAGNEAWPPMSADGADYGHTAYADDGYGHGSAETQGHHHDQSGADMGFAQAAGGDLEAGYGEEDYEYEVEEAPRKRGIMSVAAALVGAVVVGGGIAYGYQTIIGTSGSGDPPVIKSASAPSKVKPLDAGGKQFAHTDSKIMGRLGDGSAAATTAAAGSDVDANGTRKVSTLVVGRDGSIQAPSVTPAAPVATGVPGLTVVDAFNTPAAQPAPAQFAAATPEAPRVVNQAAPVKEAPPAATGSVDAKPSPAPEAPQAKPDPAPAPQRVAAAAPAARAAAPAPAKPVASGINGYVAVLASVPRSGSSRMDALKRYADLQQKYATVLAGKTPDVAEANLGAKGNYHRLVVGPPASRDQASSLCSKLKSEGYADCWVTAY